MKTTLKLVLLFIALGGTVSAQKSIRDSLIFTNLIYGTYSFEVPGADLSKRFGGFSQVGAGYLFKTRNNWLVGAEGNFGFGNIIKNEEEILKGVTTADGNVIDMSGVYTDFSFNMRTFSAFGKLGRVFPAFGPNKNSGIIFSLGFGYLQHKIYIEHRDQSAPPISGEYVKGYDDLKRGYATNVFLGYLFLGNNNKVNFFAGVDFTCGTTQHARPYSFARQQYNSGSFTDIYGGLKVGWIIPVYKRAPREFYYY
jgi:hypothetical protein